MKFEDVKIGQILEDVYGNKFEVQEISHTSIHYSILVKCIEFKKSVKVDSSGNAFTGINQVFYILRDRSILLSIDDGFGKFIKDNFYSSLALSNNLESVTVNIDDIKRNYLLGHQSTIDKIALTLSELKIVEDNYMTEDNIKLGMTVVDGLGNKYIVEDYENDSVQLSMTIETTSVDGEQCIMSMKTWVLFYDENKDEKHIITTKNFRIIEG